MAAAGEHAELPDVIDLQVSMATIASVDKTLSRVSAWMSSVAFAGVLALAFLPVRAGAAPAPPLPGLHRRPRRLAPCSRRPQWRRTTKPAPSQPSSIADPVQAVPPAPSPASFRRHSRRRRPEAYLRRRQPPAAPAVAAGAQPPAITTPPPPDVWTPEELAAGLRQCVQLLAPATADVAMEEPMKHGQCGTPAPLALRSAGGKDKVEFAPAPTMNCRLAASMGEWVDKVLQPAAQQVLGSRITRILGSGSYSCRNIYNNPKLSLSEHATGNAIDIAAFVTADGRTITVKQGLGPDRARHRRRQEEGGKEAAGRQVARARPKADETAAVAPTPSIEEAGKKAEAKQKGRVAEDGLQAGSR